MNPIDKVIFLLIKAGKPELCLSIMRIFALGNNMSQDDIFFAKQEKGVILNFVLAFVEMTPCSVPAQDVTSKVTYCNFNLNAICSFRCTRVYQLL